MENLIFNQQVQEFNALWHQILMLDQKKDFKQKYPNFLELTTNEISVIHIVSENPDIILKSICEILNLPKSTLTNTINRLEEKGYLFRTITKKDLRSYGLSLTEKGIQTQKEHIEYEHQVFGKILETLDIEERIEFLMLMKKITMKLIK
ncbi:DNA-binding MarR family transcriptional regulator [Lachnotalea glycerini]|uniref:DNA-binding MarR family transcriptional regulator n=1 Tax=Lachnotalea glycerini TaxID=1763509 RepID=A0A318EUB4_9FIRM|nr:winged helix DNA-binding protein [Lachnotalea glycerini]OYO93678.1 MarR family transcriptional regulator [Lachnotalea glycerini]PXV93303.1 DNA-binding MarR family transcriptional regulator [Lachnotalea glycerini]